MERKDFIGFGSLLDVTSRVNGLVDARSGNPGRQKVHFLLVDHDEIRVASVIQISLDTVEADGLGGMETGSFESLY